MARPRTYKTQGIVLKQMPLGEADRIITLYSADRGQIRAVARGVRRIKSRLAGHLEPLTHVAVSVAEGKSLDAITEAETVHSFKRLREDLRRVSEGVYVAELVDGFSAEQSPNPGAFSLLLNTMRRLQRADQTTLVLRHFEVRLLEVSGFGPELRQCVECRSELEPGDYLFSSARGGILCRRCQVTSEDALVPVSLNAIKVLRYLQREPHDEVAALRVPAALLQELERVLRTFIRYLLERELKSADFMDDVAATTPT